MKAKMSAFKRFYLFWLRNLFRLFYVRSIHRNKKKRILVVLHLFYMESWDIIEQYLKNLDVYNYDLVVTYIKDNFDAGTLDKVKQFHKNTKLYMYENKGFDIGPFIDVLRSTDLSKYDIVFKLHSKGTGRKHIYVYNQIFKYADWFYNLYNGILGPASVHKAINAFNNEKIGLVAAKNLIIEDPKHKQFFTHTIADKLKIKIKEHYKYVAGSCFALRASCLQKIQNLKLKIDDFEITTRGVFSLAHAMERIVCATVETQGYQEYGIYTRHRKYAKEVRRANKKNSIRLLDDKRFRLDYEFFYHDLEMLKIRNYDIIEIALKDIYRMWDGKKYHLDECSPYAYLNGDTKRYKKYCDTNKATKPYDMSTKRFNDLITSIEKNGFDKKQIPVINGRDFTIWDGQHRCCILLKKYGPDYKIKVLALYP